MSKHSFHAAVETEKGIFSKEFPYSEEGLQRFLAFLPEGAHCIMESTGTYHCRLAYFLVEQGVAVSVVNPLSVKRYAQALLARTKTDKADSGDIFSFANRTVAHLHLTPLRFPALQTDSSPPPASR